MPDSGAEDDSSDESDAEDGTNKTKKKSKDSTGVYVPPKLSAVHYDGDDTKADRTRKQLDRSRKRALKYVSNQLNLRVRIEALHYCRISFPSSVAHLSYKT